MSRARDIANLQSSKITADAGIDIDNINIDGTEISISSGDLTIAANHASGDLIFEANGATWYFTDGDATQFSFQHNSGNITFKTAVSNDDFIITGVDDGSAITALTLDMSEAGAATFNSTVIAKAATLSRSSSNSPNVEPVLLFDNIDTVIGANENIGSIRFTTSGEDSGTDANLESGRIACFSESGHGSTTNASALAFYTASSEAASERMRITSAGQLSVGLAGTPDSHIKILSAGTNTTNYIGLRNTTASDGSGTRYSYINYEGTQSGGEISTLAQIGAEHQGTADDEKGNLVFTTNDGNDGDSPNERMRIGNNGRITSTTIVDDWNLVLSNGNSTAPYGQSISWGSAAPDNNTSIFLYCADSSVARLYIYADGDVVNHDNSYGSISDERIKQDIVDANSQWDDIKAVKVRNYKKKDDVEQYGDKAGSQIGVIAQELETVSPKLVKEASPSASDIRHSAEFGTLYEDGDTIPDGKEVGDVKEIKENVKKVSYSVLYMKAIKALQEAMSRIETLEAKVAKLEE